jgi:hypothetical protein
MAQSMIAQLSRNWQRFHRSAESAAIAPRAKRLSFSPLTGDDRMKRKVMLILAAAIMPFGPAAALPNLTPAGLNAQVASRGARAVASQLTDGQIDAIAAHASAGEAKWLQAAARLRPGLDGAKAEGSILPSAGRLR